MSESISRDHENDQPGLEKHDKHAKTRACDLISRRAAINALREEFKKSPTTAIRAMSAIKILPAAQPERTCETCRYNNRTWDMEPCDSCTIGGKDSHYEPSAQPEIIRCKDCKHKHLENMVWTCPFGLPGGENFFCGYGAEPYKGEQE